MDNTTSVPVIVMVALLVSVVALLFLYFRNKTLEDIRKDVYQLFLEAEHTFTETAAGNEKMAFVLNAVREILPVWARIFVTESLLKKIVQCWFDAIKDLLDDGKYNQSSKEDLETIPENGLYM